MRRKFLLLGLFLWVIATMGYALDISSTLGYVIRINIPSRTLELYYNGKFARGYPVGVGMSSSFMTPVGKYSILSKIQSPIWEHPYKGVGESRIANNSKSNPLGDYWLGFYNDGSGEYGIHGTNKPDSIGKFVSHGCVRMQNDDIEELFSLVPKETPVLITYERFRFLVENNQIYLKIYPDPYKKGSPSKETMKVSLAQIVNLQNVIIYPDALRDTLSGKMPLEEYHQIGIIDYSGYR